MQRTNATVEGHQSLKARAAKVLERNRATQQAGNTSEKTVLHPVGTDATGCNGATILLPPDEPITRDALCHASDAVARAVYELLRPDEWIDGRGVIRKVE